jgi:hypothetical protein
MVETEYNPKPIHDLDNITTVDIDNAKIPIANNLLANKTEYITPTQLLQNLKLGLSDSTTQSFALNTPTPVTFNTQRIVNGIVHSTITDSEEITFPTAGVYLMTVEPQIGRVAGSNTQVLNLFVQISTDGGTIFNNLADSNIKVTIGNTAEKTVAPLTQTFSVNANDILRVMVSVEDANLVIQAVVADVIIGIPATPSIIANIVRIGE